MATAIHLLGPPRVMRDGTAQDAPRGRKPWGLLAYLLRSELPPSREHLVSLLFADAEDPLAALRWNLSALRKLLGQPDTLHGDPVRLTLPADTLIDVDVVARGSWAEALHLPGLGRELLEGTDFSASPAFDLWLAMERRHVDGLTHSVLHEAAQARLGTGDARGAAELATRLVQLDPYDESANVLLVQALTAAGERAEARRHVDRCRELFARELGIEPSAALGDAAAAPSRAAGEGGRHAALAQLEAGEAAIAAGAVDTGLSSLRGAVAEARRTGDAPTLARSLLALGSALVHAARGRDDEAGAALHEALVVADREALSLIGAAAARELGYVEFLRGRYERAETWLERAGALAGDDPRERAAIGNVLGATLTDRGLTGAATEVLEASCADARSSHAPRLLAYGLSMLGRARHFRDDGEGAAVALEESLAFAEREWTAFVPFPLSLLGDCALAAGDAGAAEEAFERAFALGCQIGDPCWEGVSARGLGLVAAAKGDVTAAVDLLVDAQTRCMRFPDAWFWAKAYALEALCGIAIEHRLAGAPAWIDELAALAGQTGMQELSVRTHVHRARLGVDGAAAVAVALAASLDNPVLVRLAASLPGSQSATS